MWKEHPIMEICVKCALHIYCWIQSNVAFYNDRKSDILNSGLHNVYKSADVLSLLRASMIF